MSDVSQRLKAEADGAEFSNQYADLCMEAHNEIDHLREENAAQAALIEFYERGGKPMDVLKSELGIEEGQADG